MQIIPVIDLKNRQVVRGIAGRRDEYRPIESIIATDPQPATVAKAFVDLNLTDIYVADLDAIAGAEPAWDLYHQMAHCGARLTIDAGLSDRSRATEMAEFLAADLPLAGIVAGLESLVDLDLLIAFVEIIGTDRLVFSLDLKQGRPLTDAAAWRELDATQIANMAIAAGVQRMIVLDLHRVGSGQGVGTEPLCRQLADQHPHLEIIAGGGIRHADDLHSLFAAGCSATLVASALHDGRIGKTDIHSTTFR